MKLDALYKRARETCGLQNTNPRHQSNSTKMSIQSRNLKISEIPLSQISRPIAPVLDTAKINAMVSTMQGTPTASKTCTLEQAEASEGLLPPVDIMRISDREGVRFFAFGGCHRLQAYDRIAQSSGEDPMVRCKVIPTTKQQLALYLGSSVENLGI